MQFTKIVSSLSLVSLLMAGGISNSWADGKMYPGVIKGDPVTGVNVLKGVPIRDFGEDSVGTLNFFNVAAYVPGGDYPSEITMDTPNDALMATGIDSKVAAMAGLNITNVDPAVLNVPLRDVPMNVSPDGLTRAPAANALDVDHTVPSQAAPVKAITLDDWLKSSGNALVNCETNGASVELRMKDLIPNRLYTVWALYESGIPRPFGGAPNVFMTNEKGDGRFKRDISFCPFDDTDDNILQLSIVYHSDHQVYAALPDLPLRQDAGTGYYNFFTGIISHSQLEFAFRGTRIE